MGVAGPDGPAGPRGPEGPEGSVPSGCGAWLPKSMPLPRGWEWVPLANDENTYRIQWAKLVGGEPWFQIRKT